MGRLEIEIYFHFGVDLMETSIKICIVLFFLKLTSLFGGVIK